MHRQDIRSLPGHRDHVGTEGLGRLAGDHGTGVEHLLYPGRWLPVVRHQRAATGQLPQQEGAAGVLVPGGVVPQAEPGGELRQCLGVPGAVLADIVAHEVHAKTAHPAQQVQQGTICNYLHPALDERLVAGEQRPPQLVAGMQHLPFRHALTCQLCLDGKPGVTQQIPQLTQHHAIGLVGTAGQFPQGLVAAGHGEFLHEVHHICQVQVGGLPATEQHHLRGDAGGDIGIAVPVAPHPGHKRHRRGVQGQVLTATVEQGAVQPPQELRHRPPQGVLHHRETPLCLVHGGGPLGTKVIAEPDLGDQFPQPEVQALALALGQPA